MLPSIIRGHRGHIGLGRIVGLGRHLRKIVDYVRLVARRHGGKRLARLQLHDLDVLRYGRSNRHGDSFRRNARQVLQVRTNGGSLAFHGMTGNTPPFGITEQRLAAFDLRRNRGLCQEQNQSPNHTTPPEGLRSRSFESEISIARFNANILLYMKLALLIAAAVPCALAADYQLKASPATVVWGYYWAQAKPVLTIRSGDRVEIQTLTTSSPTSLANNGVKPEEIEPELKAIYAEVKDKGPGGHILTGPIFVEG